jgi:hypothetical protein
LAWTTSLYEQVSQAPQIVHDLIVDTNERNNWLLYETHWWASVSITNKQFGTQPPAQQVIVARGLHFTYIECNVGTIIGKEVGGGQECPSSTY